jgi:hypothetical protein
MCSAARSHRETKRLLAVAIKARILLSLSYGCGLRAGEVVPLKVKHIDSAQKIIRIEQSKVARIAMSCYRPRRSICCGNGGRRAHRVTMREHPLRNIGCFQAGSLFNASSVQQLEGMGAKAVPGLFESVGFPAGSE